MKIISVKTQKVTKYDTDLFPILQKYLPVLKERSIVVITSKIVSVCEGRLVKIEGIDKKKLIEQEADYYLPPEGNKHNITLTIKRNLLVPTAGIDESNGNGYFILWPNDPQKTANEIRVFLQKTYAFKNVGVIITDSKTSPMRWGTTGIAIVHSGFAALNNYIGKPDIFDRYLHVTKANVLDALAAASVVVMGEGNEQTPLAVIEDVPFVQFQNRNPLATELKELHIPMENDLYGPILKSVKWLKGK
ncbi:putative folate metabolism gamma-glutamate ligase [Candidatus Roizmanbacteria bacterium CG09_land_8_20_14_0_10_41_9]|uniref:Putative folate metabolism gamma-glutamate ligase n=1 Tax=Candidatus Roizmanbacteria bacterium CG09_land_8_20_14_0_10_41_9 TaxID=1974850 RepID=A0A2H0WVV6_9BACT|nr:MAG: putative folate metabolism gamma-glutamate ligase [Candidatus Roizmanbacteria bacterium CG09_land_8_20_14_0_10_41_9]